MSRDMLAFFINPGYMWCQAGTGEISKQTEAKLPLIKNCNRQAKKAKTT